MATPESQISPVPAGPSPGPLPRSRPLSLRKKLVFSAIVTVAVLAGFEGVLALLGVRPATYDDDPYVGFSRHIPLFVEEQAPDGRTVLATAPNKLSFFNKQSFPRKKAPGTIRIFGLGGSTTFGHPYDDRTSFCGWLRELLPVADPSKNWEVINAGGISYASYRVAALMEELLQYEPDVFVIYDGHNEFLEQRTYKEIRESSPIVRELSAVLSRTRTFSVLERALRSTNRPSTLSPEVETELDQALDNSVGPSKYHRDDALRNSVFDHFRLNLARMAQMARSVGARVVFITPAAKLRDCEPFRSEPSAGLSADAQQAFRAAMGRGDEAVVREDWAAALAAYDEALAIDPRYAHAHYFRARALDRLGRTEEARAAYLKSIEEDVCPLRAAPELQQIMGEVAEQSATPLIDHVRDVEARAADGIPGDAEFLDHVHPTIKENRLLALEIIKVLTGMGLAKPASTWGDAAVNEVVERIERTLKPSEHGDALTQIAQIYNWAGRIEESGRLAQRALELVPDNAEAQFLAGCAASSQGDQQAATEHYREAIRLRPIHWAAQNNLGKILEVDGQFDEAIRCYEAALEAKPDYAIAHNNLGRTYAATGAVDRAVFHLEQALRLRPDYASAHENLGLLFARQGNMHRAAASFSEATRLDPTSSTAFSNLGSALANLNDLTGAERAFSIALELDPKSDHARRGRDRLKELPR